jgi:AmmeMemoRadiSam system protein A
MRCSFFSEIRTYLSRQVGFSVHWDYFTIFRVTVSRGSSRGFWVKKWLCKVRFNAPNADLCYTHFMDFEIGPVEQKFLLAVGRESIASKLEGRKPDYRREEYGEAANSAVLQQPCGAFVTLHKQGNLRGCIGRMTASLPLEETVRLMAREAAFGDPRFPPLRTGELEQCKIEISALSPMSVCPDARQVKVGVHGLYLVRGGRAGVLLPQVPVEQGWDLDEYLDYICVKAGLPPESYNASDATLYTFTAVVFGEED